MVILFIKLFIYLVEAYPCSQIVFGYECQLFKSNSENFSSLYLQNFASKSKNEKFTLMLIN